ncbi:hypothetical protein H8703_09390, partial [Bifidobacterium faecale]|uniref:hypothetical protein n=1 Tax=Bifidobacterium adolescentis TaxID=1680 RepID=UPI001997E866|nr:hypothetical protein [Bifidobacterium faecale]
NILMRNCHAEDTRATARMIWPATLNVAAGKVLKNIRIENMSGLNYGAALKAEVNTNAANVSGGMVGVDIVYTAQNAADVAASTSLHLCGGKRVNVTASSTNMTLPAAANCKGLHFEVQTAPGVNSVSLVPQAGDMIRWNGDAAGQSVVLDDCALVVVRSLGGTDWIVESISGRTRRGGTSMAKKIVWTTAAPTTGAWVVGDMAINASPAVGQPKGWRCTVAGTPGTWVSEGNL